MNGFGHRFRLSVWGESHGPQVGITLDGVPEGMALSEADFEADLARRRSGAAGTTPRRESDQPRILSGVWRGFTTGAPLTVVFGNGDCRSEDYAALAAHCRPSHADWVAGERFRGYNDPRGGGHFSGRLTVLLVAAGVVAKKMLPRGIVFHTAIERIGGESDPQRRMELLAGAQAEGDSLGGVITCRVEGVPAGWGEPFFDSVESVMSHLIFSIPGVRGVEFGDGFAAADMRGSQHNDPITDARGTTLSNHAGGVVGGLTNSNPLVVRVAVKPTASIAREQMTFNKTTGRVEPLRIGGRHDVCIALRAAVVVEAAAAVALADLMPCKP